MVFYGSIRFCMVLYGFIWFNKCLAGIIMGWVILLLMVLYGMINGVNIHWIIIGIRIEIITGIYPPVSSNLASWEIPELNGSFNGKTNYKWWIFHCHVWSPDISWVLYTQVEVMIAYTEGFTVSNNKANKIRKQLVIVYIYIYIYIHMYNIPICSYPYPSKVAISLKNKKTRAQETNTLT